MRRAHRAEFGWGKVTRLVPESSLLRGLPDEFHVFQAHQDEVSELPRGMKLLARSEACAIQACEVEGKPAWGIQFHPERAAEAGERSLEKRLREQPRAELLNRGKGAKLYDPRVGDAIFRNFLTPEAAR